MADLEQSGNRIPNKCSMIFTFLLIATFYLTRSENRIKIFLTQLSSLILLFFSKGTIFVKTAIFCKNKNTDINKIKKVQALKGIFSETTYLCVLMYQISSF